MSADGRPLPGARSVVQDMNVQMTPGSRCLLIGPNGAVGPRLLQWVIIGVHPTQRASSLDWDSAEQCGVFKCQLWSAGAGKTSLLRILAGKHKVPEAAVKVLGEPPFYNTLLTTRCPPLRSISIHTSHQ